MVAQATRCVWVLLSYRIPREPSTPRIAVWRTLKRLGVAQIGDGLAALPADARTQEQLEWLAEEIADAAGTSTLWRAELTSAVQERSVVHEMATARSVEYVEIAARARTARETLDRTESLRALRSLRRELRRVQRRDFFPPIQRDLAKAEVDALAQSVLGDASPGPIGAADPTSPRASGAETAEVES